MPNLDFSPFYRSTVGYDRLFNRLDNIVGQQAKTYPPYNIERLDDDSWRVTVAVSGFSQGDISIETKENNLTIKGGKSTETEEQDRNFLHRGIAERSFELRYQLGDYVEVVAANLENGLLNVDLKREVPEEKKARQIPIAGAQANTANIADKSVN
jgi:molecular chaperone IbpA